MDDNQNFKEGSLLPAKRLAANTASLPKIQNVNILHNINEFNVHITVGLRLKRCEENYHG